MTLNPPLLLPIPSRAHHDYPSLGTMKSDEGGLGLGLMLLLPPAGHLGMSLLGLGLWGFQSCLGMLLIKNFLVAPLSQAVIGNDSFLTFVFFFFF